MDNRKTLNLANFSYYDLLCIKANATPEEIKTAYRNQTWKWHPDQAKNYIQEEDLIYAEPLFKVLNEAHEVLSNPGKRVQYDSNPNNPSCLEQGQSLFTIWLKYHYESYVYLQASKIQELQDKVYRLEDQKRVQTTYPTSRPSHPTYPTSFSHAQPQQSYTSRFYEQPSQQNTQKVREKIKAYGLLRIGQVYEELGSKTYNYLHLHFASREEAEKFHTGHWKFLVSLEKEDALLHVQSYNVLNLPEVLKVTIMSSDNGKGEIVLSKFGKYVEIDNIPKSLVFCDPKVTAKDKYAYRR